jgi:hypothetical protein
MRSSREPEACARPRRDQPVGSWICFDCGISVLSMRLTLSFSK